MVIQKSEDSFHFQVKRERNKRETTAGLVSGTSGVLILS